MQPSRSSRSRPIRIGLGVGAMALGAIALLHAGAAGRALLRRAHLACPVLSVTPAEAARTRELGLAPLRGGRRGPARPALGFALDASREADVIGWAARVGAICARQTRGFTFLDCRPRRPIPAARSGAADTLEASDVLTFAFGPGGTLTSVDLLHRPGSQARAARLFEAARDRLTAPLGGPGERSGTIDAVARSGQLMATALVRYRFRDYLAAVTAIRLRSGLVVREQYQSAL